MSLPPSPQFSITIHRQDSAVKGLSAPLSVGFYNAPCVRARPYVCIRVCLDQCASEKKLYFYIFCLPRETDALIWAEVGQERGAERNT